MAKATTGDHGHQRFSRGLPSDRCTQGLETDAGWVCSPTTLLPFIPKPQKRKTMTEMKREALEPATYLESGRFGSIVSSAIDNPWCLHRVSHSGSTLSQHRVAAPVFPLNFPSSTHNIKGFSSSLQLWMARWFGLEKLPRISHHILFLFSLSFIGTVQSKGCRDALKLCLLGTQQFPITNSLAV